MTQTLEYSNAEKGLERDVAIFQVCIDQFDHNSEALCDFRYYNRIVKYFGLKRIQQFGKCKCRSRFRSGKLRLRRGCTVNTARNARGCICPGIGDSKGWVLAKDGSLRNLGVGPGKVLS